MATKTIEDYMRDASSFENGGTHIHLSASCMAASVDVKGEKRQDLIITAQTFALWAIVERLDALLGRSHDA